MHDEILSLIDNIDKVKEESEFHVLESMIDAYAKSAFILENYDGGYDEALSIFQEGEILDRVKEEGKDDSTLKKILWFIPRVIRALIQSIKVPDDFKEKADKLKEFGEKLNKLPELEKKAKVEELNKQFNGEAEVYLDEKSGKIKFKKNLDSFLAKLALHGTLVLSTFNLFKRIQKEFDILEPSNLRTFIEDCDAIIHGEKQMKKSELFNEGIDALGDLTKDIFAVSGEVTVIGAEICTKMDDIIRKDMIKDIPSEKKQATAQNIKDLASKVTIINGMVSAAMKAFDKVLDWGEFFGFLVDKSESNKEEFERVQKLVEAKNPQRPDENLAAYHTRLWPLIKAERKRAKKEEKENIKQAYADEKQRRKDAREARKNNAENKDNK